MTKKQYLETALRLYNEGKISAVTYDAMVMNAEEFVFDEEDN